VIASETVHANAFMSLLDGIRTPVDGHLIRIREHPYTPLHRHPLSIASPKPDETSISWRGPRIKHRVPMRVNALGVSCGRC
jgi:hypothetical protein